MNLQTQRRRPGPEDIFADRGRASDAPTPLQTDRPRAHVEVVGAGGQLLNDDPQQIVHAVVRPHHHWDGAPAGTVVKVSYGEFEAHQAALCTPAEYAKITAQEASPQHQATQRQLQEMRRATTDATLRSLPPEKRAELERLQAQARADDSKELRLRQEMAQAAAPPAPAAAPAPAAVDIPATAQELEALIAQRRAATTQAMSGALPRVAERLRQLMDEEEVELRRDFLAAQEQAQAAAARAQRMAELVPSSARAAAERQLETYGQGGKPVAYQAPPEQRLATLKGLYEQGLITAEVYQQRQAAIVAEV